jgi:hypothetical protein
MVWKEKGLVLPQHAGTKSLRFFILPFRLYSFRFFNYLMTLLPIAERILELKKEGITRKTKQKNPRRLKTKKLRM